MIDKKCEKIIEPILSAGGIGVIPTDTLYGIVGSALLRATVEKIYILRKREKTKPMIILISSLDDLFLFDIEINSKIKKVLKKAWPGKVSVILQCKSKKWDYLHRGKKNLAFRLPANLQLRKLLQKTGPLVAPSANFEGEAPAMTFKEAQKYFGNKIDFYIDNGKIKSKPSTIISLNSDANIKILRQGEIKI